MKSYIDCIIANSNEEFNISLNPDIFETNIINIVILLGILFVVIKNFLTENLTSRKEKIVETIESAEAQLTDSNNRYIEAQKQWAQVDIIIKEINQQMETTKRNLLKLKWNQTKEDLSKKFALAIEILHNRENKIFADVIREVSKKALNRVINKLVNQLGKVEQSAIINRKIAQLGD
uniref:ATP synthase CF0 B subunit n=1 Tax=Sargassum hemiphyllum var. chinense TaxID=425012 RepID=A0A7G9XKV2_SARHM|nr:AtpF [Sargassum hemiphyllum var. chinense]QPZ94183.1 ATP synthase CF0 B subunit [Sargassum hemiphyllum var. chinense]